MALLQAETLDEAQPEGLFELLKVAEEEIEPLPLAVEDRETLSVEQTLLVLHGDGVELREEETHPETVPVESPLKLQSLLGETLPDSDTLPVIDALKDDEEVADAQGDVLAVPQ